MDQFTEDQAITIYESRIWEGMTARQIVEMQLPQRRLCVPFGVFHESVETVLGRPVYTHEFAGDEGFKRINDEVFNGAKPPTFEEIVNMIPADKRVLLVETEKI